jgi:hypothetical protein
MSGIKRVSFHSLLECRCRCPCPSAKWRNPAWWLWGPSRPLKHPSNFVCNSLPCQPIEHPFEHPNHQDTPNIQVPDFIGLISSSNISLLASRRRAALYRHNRLQPSIILASLSATLTKNSRLLGPLLCPNFSALLLIPSSLPPTVQISTLGSFWIATAETQTSRASPI